MTFEHHPLLNAIIADRRSRVRRREDGIIELTERRPSTGIGDRSFNAEACRARAPAKAPARAPRRHSIARAMLSAPAEVLDVLVEGCALYAIAMNPGAFWCSSQNADRDDPTDDAAGPRGLVPQRELATAIRPARPAVTVCRKTVRASRPRWLRRVASLPGRFWSKLRHWHEQWRAARALYAFNDRMLKDIGISRCDIEYLQQGGETKRITR